MLDTKQYTVVSYGNGVYRAEITDPDARKVDGDLFDLLQKAIIPSRADANGVSDVVELINHISVPWMLYFRTDPEKTKPEPASDPKLVKSDTKTLLQSVAKHGGLAFQSQAKGV